MAPFFGVMAEGRKYRALFNMQSTSPELSLISAMVEWIFWENIDGEV